MSSTTFTGALVQMLASDFPMILSLIFGGCCSQLITFGQFAFVALEGIRNHITWGTYGPKLKPTVVPLSNWLFLVTMFFIVSVLNNLALGYNISVPLHIIFRSGGLIVNMILGALILKKRYSLDQIVGVLFVTAGVIWATIDNASTHNESNPGSTAEFITGILLLMIAMLLSAGMGLFQEVTYKKYGKQWREGLFYTHFLALPFFLFFYKDLVNQVAAYNKSPLMSISDVFEQVPLMDYVNRTMPQVVLSILQTIYVPKLWAFLFMNMITQYACIAGVNRMTSVATSLTLNLVLNLRKFSSLLFSIVYFENDFGFGAKMGTALVFLGTLIYTRAGLKANHKQQQQVASKKAN
ncbi:UAA transporter [Gilbertella persicaria]|nr:UAA transporter [Gilbertella persicaria]KAI8098384.1 UAA transporter [Gilbertella persicaria]